MLATPFTKGIRDRWLGMVVTAVSIGVMFWFGGWVYQDMGTEILDFFSGIPETFMTMFGFVEGAGAVGIILGEMVNFIAPLALAGMAISIGTGAVAREERIGVFELLLSNPRSRTKVVTEKIGAALVLIALGGGLIFLATLSTGSILGVSYENLHPLSASIHVTSLAWFFGMLALAIGAWTGRAGVASGTAGGLLVASWLAASLLPLIESAADFAKLSPWHYLSSSTPLLSGTDWGDVGVLWGLTALCIVAALVGVNRRDLKSGWTGGNLRARLSAMPQVGKLVSKLSGNGASVGSVFTKTLGDGRFMATVTAIILGYMGVLMGLLYNAMDDMLIQFAGALPEEMMQVLGIEDMSTAYGFLNAELFAITGPIALIYVATAMASRSIAGEQDRGSMDALLANPVPRTHVLYSKAAAIAVISFGLSVALSATTWLGVVLAGIELSTAGLVGVTIHMTAFGWVFSGVALLIAALTGTARLASAGAAGVAFLTYVINAFLSVSDRLSGWTKATPWYYYGASNPLEHGLDLGHLGVLVALAAVLTIAAALAFDRADIK